MNTTGFIRGYMARSMKDKDFLKFIISTLSKEFEKEVRLNIINDEYLIIMDRYRAKMGKIYKLPLIETKANIYSIALESYLRKAC